MLKGYKCTGCIHACSKLTVNDKDLVNGPIFLPLPVFAFMGTELFLWTGESKGKMTEGERPQADAVYVEDAVMEPWPELA